MDNAVTTMQQQPMMAASPSMQPSQLLRFRHSPALGTPSAAVNYAKPQPISIPLGSSAAMPYPYAMPLHMLHQHHASSMTRYASAPTTADSPFLHSAPPLHHLHHQPIQIKQPSALPPHLRHTAMSHMGSSPQLPYMYGSLPSELGTFVDTFSDTSDTVGAAANSAGGGESGNLAAASSSIYNLHVPPQSEEGAIPRAVPSLPSLNSTNPAIAFSLPMQHGAVSSTAGASFGSTNYSPSNHSPLPSAGLMESSAYTTSANHRRTLTEDSTDSISNVPLMERSALAASSQAKMFTASSGDSDMMAVDYTAMHQDHYSLPSDFGTLIPTIENSDGSMLACNSQAYIDLISSYGLQHQQQDSGDTVGYSPMFLDGKLASGWESQNQQMQSADSPGLLSHGGNTGPTLDAVGHGIGREMGIAPELTLYPPYQHDPPPNT
ncbi:hypothetical protein GGI04_002896 [Coemansia thaxteri]|nr:hypothetical protein GGI04_002896 [Coemansia thaxteri]